MFSFRVAMLSACTLCLASAAGPAAAADAPAGTIAGTVRTSAGGPVGGAPIAVTEQGGHATRIVRTNASGTYEATGLAPGVYQVTADMQGFRVAVRKDQSLAAGARVVVDFTLEFRFAAETKVTAMKRDDTIENIPVSVAAPTEDALRDRGAETIEDVAANVAGFSIQNLGPGQSQVAMRGVSSGQIARDQPGVKEQVGAYLDESVISMSLFTPDLDFVDTSRIEVLRGPQGTLFGSGSLSGTVRYITNQPELGLTKSFAELTGATTTHGSQSGSAKAGFNVPLGDLAALRTAVYYDHNPGYINAVQPDLSVKNALNGGDRMGFRAALAIAPSDDVVIIPRVVYQKATTDGWNRTDVYNILGNPYTTTRPKVFLGDREQFTQIPEPYTDKFLLGDLTMKFKLGDVLLTSVTSYTHRDVLVVRDAGALTSSITGGSFGLPASVYTLDSPLNDATKATGWTQELRASGSAGRLQWVAGGFYADNDRHYDQQLHVGGYEALVPTGGLANTRTLAGKDVLYWSNLDYKLKQFALFGEATYAITKAFSVTAGLRYYHFDEDKAQVFDGLFGSGSDGKPVSQPGTTKADGVAPRFIVSYKVSDSTTLNAQAAKGFRLGGVNDPTNYNLCTPQDRVTFSGYETWKDETAWNYEVGAKTRFLGGKGSLSVSGFYTDISDLQVTVTAGSCSSRLIFNVPKSRSVGGEFELGLTPNDHFDFSLSASYASSEIRSTIAGTSDLVASTGIREGNRLPSVPKFQMALSGTYQQDVAPGFQGYVTATYNHVGSRYTQLADQEAGVGTLNLLSFGANTIGGPLTQSTFTFDPLLPSYDLVNLRLGVRHGYWDVALYVNNLTDQSAYLALDRERGFRARVGYLTNQPRTFGISSRFDF
ncbi:MAG TPA: TonB-dependent receptor [Thermoanaerobaculia bacterium]|jgi:iron complex outermembrane receptor protein